MKAILVNDDRSLRWDNVPDPICGEEDCLVKIEAAALNRADLMQREGVLPSNPSRFTSTSYLLNNQFPGKSMFILI